MQFTPDVLPSDILGFNMLEQKTGEFTFKKGAIFTNLLLADEINRTSPKTQSALLEVMEEKRVSVDGTTYQLDPPFFVIATQNPIGASGTQKLPDSQLDRFLKDWITNILDQGFKPEQARENEVTPEQFAEAVTE